MSINKTQEFVFESDELSSVMTMFEAIAKILYDMKDYTRPVILLEQPLFWEDGRYNAEWRKSLDTYIYETTDGSSVLLPCATYGGATMLKKHGDYKNNDKAAKVACSLHQKPKPTRMWIASVTHGQWIGPKTKIHQPKSLDELSNKVKEIAEGVDKKDFLEKFQEFEHPELFDCSVGMGYRLEWRADGGSDTLDLSAVHVYYGK
jgi:hypothetical protein